MPAKTTVEKAKKDLREGKRPTTAAGEFIHEEMEHIRRGKHGARSPSRRRSKAVEGVLRRESRPTASKRALSKQAKRAAARRRARAKK